ncbi:hypothetical protein GCM10027298_11500 [Epidermidibacterium keratini]
MTSPEAVLPAMISTLTDAVSSTLDTAVSADLALEVTVHDPPDGELLPSLSAELDLHVSVGALGVDLGLDAQIALPGAAVSVDIDATAPIIGPVGPSPGLVVLDALNPSGLAPPGTADGAALGVAPVASVDQPSPFTVPLGSPAQPPAAHLPAGFAGVPGAPDEYAEPSAVSTGEAMVLTPDGVAATALIPVQALPAGGASASGGGGAAIGVLAAIVVVCGASLRRRVRPSAGDAISFRGTGPDSRPD